jgi:hypothetical protein
VLFCGEDRRPVNGAPFSSSGQTETARRIAQALITVAVESVDPILESSAHEAGAFDSAPRDQLVFDVHRSDEPPARDDFKRTITLA